jgi:peptide deformylase
VGAFILAACEHLRYETANRGNGGSSQSDASQGQSEAVKVTVTNTSDEYRHQVVELDAKDVFRKRGIQGGRQFIVFDNAGTAMAMLNPEIVKASGLYETEEGCLSLEGVRKTKRYRSIKVQYQNENLQTRLKTFTGWTAQIIQHEIDHCNGILI